MRTKTNVWLVYIFLREHCPDGSWTVAYEAGGRGGAAAPPAWKIQGKLCFQGKRNLLKILKDKQYFHTVKNFRANSVFQDKHRLFEILNDEK